MFSSRVLVAGTTCDYVDWIRKHRPGKSLFITKRELRKECTEFESPQNNEEILIDDESHEEIWQLVSTFIKKYNIRICGVVGYDCESLFLVSYLAKKLELPYPSEDAVINCRQKIRAVNLWKQAGLYCPESRVVHSAEEATTFYLEIGNTIVIKPLTGSGSEHTFKCETREEVISAYTQAEKVLERRRKEAMFTVKEGGSTEVLACKFISGIEYSCDFFVPKAKVSRDINSQDKDSRDSVCITRLCRKYPLPEGPFGTTGAYEPLYEKEWPVDKNTLCETLKKAAFSVGLSGIVCMADMIVQDGKIYLLEMAARPAGDCLLWFMNYAWQLDSVSMVHELAEGKTELLTAECKKIGGTVNKAANGTVNKADVKKYIALRLFADKNGVIKSFDTEKLLDDSRVCSDSLNLQYDSGHEVILPPEDFDSRILGYVAYIPDRNKTIAEQNAELREKFSVIYETV